MWLKALQQAVSIATDPASCFHRPREKIARRKFREGSFSLTVTLTVTLREGKTATIAASRGHEWNPSGTSPDIWFKAPRKR